MFGFDDDGPTQTVTANAGAAAQLEVALDETTGDSDHYAIGETADSYVNDDVAGALAQRTTAVSGGLAALFTASGSHGSDLAGTLTPSLTLVGVPAGGLATSLTATHGGAITLFADSATQLSGKDTDGHTVFTIAIIDIGGGELQLRTTLFEALDNGNDTLFDEAVDLLLPPARWSCSTRSPAAMPRATPSSPPTPSCSPTTKTRCSASTTTGRPRR
ncbi:DUF5801 repeats-in-toxin domain-containing protein [Azotobacter chroococcum]